MKNTNKKSGVLAFEIADPAEHVPLHVSVCFQTAAGEK